MVTTQTELTNRVTHRRSQETRLSAMWQQGFHKFLHYPFRNLHSREFDKEKNNFSPRIAWRFGFFVLSLQRRLVIVETIMKQVREYMTIPELPQTEEEAVEQIEELESSVSSDWMELDEVLDNIEKQYEIYAY